MQPYSCLDVCMTERMFRFVNAECHTVRNGGEGDKNTVFQAKVFCL